jgi:hypothetical protein
MQTIEFHTKIKNGIIQIPDHYRSIVADDVRVILTPKSEQATQSDIISKLMTNPLNVKGFKPLTRDEAYARD